MTILADEVQVLFDEHHRHLRLFNELDQNLPDLLDDIRLNSFGWFIQQ